LDEGINYNISSLMTGTTNSSIIDGTSSMNSSIYEQIPSMNSSVEMSMRNSMTKSANDRNRVKWWDDLTEETATEMQEIIDQGECRTLSLLKHSLKNTNFIKRTAIYIS
jgi:hypothetical protein